MSLNFFRHRIKNFHLSVRVIIHENFLKWDEIKFISFCCWYVNMNQTFKFFQMINIWFIVCLQFVRWFFFVLFRWHQISDIINNAYRFVSKKLKQLDSNQHWSSHLYDRSIKSFRDVVFFRRINSDIFHFDVVDFDQFLKFFIFDDVIIFKNDRFFVCF